MPYMRTQYNKTGALPDPTGLLGPAILAGSLVSGVGVSMRNPTPIIVASLSIQGSVYADAYSIMAIYYGSGVMPSGFVLTPVGIALASQGIVGGMAPLVIAPLTSVLSMARSLGGHSGQIGYGLFNSGSTSRFLVLGQSAAGGGTYTIVSAENAIIHFLVASSPAIDGLN